jgi:hypothetical protein
VPRSVRSTLRANQTDSDVSVLANPRIRARNREKAKILIGDRVPNITSTITATGFSSESVTYIDVGLKLDIEPTIYLDNEVAIKVTLEVSNIVDKITTKTGTVAYQIGTRTATSVLRLKDGENQLLAGLISDEDRRTASKLPFLGDIPLLGRLFGRAQRRGDQDRDRALDHAAHPAQHSCGPSKPIWPSSMAAPKPVSVAARGRRRRRSAGRRACRPGPCRTGGCRARSTWRLAPAAAGGQNNPASSLQPAASPQAGAAVDPLLASVNPVGGRAAVGGAPECPVGTQASRPGGRIGAAALAGSDPGQGR